MDVLRQKILWQRIGGGDGQSRGREKRGQAQKTSAFSFGAMAKAVSHPTVGVLLILIFAQQIAFGGFEQILALFTLNRLGLNASGNAIIFVFVGIITLGLMGFAANWGLSRVLQRVAYRYGIHL